MQLCFLAPAIPASVMVENIPQVLPRHKELKLTIKEAEALELYRKKELKVKDILAMTNVNRTTFYRKLNLINEPTPVLTQ